MTQSQAQSIQFLETQPGFHRNKVRGYKEAVESICHLPLDEDFTAKILEDFRQFQGFDIIQFSKITCLIKKFCVTSNFQCEVEKFLEMCQRQEMGMDISVFLKIVLDILSSKETTENTVTSLDSTMKELEKLYNELAGSGAFNIRETEQTLYFLYSSEYYHPSSRFLECYDTLKWRLHQENGRLLINSTVSLIRVEKARKVLGYPPGWAQGPVLKAWLKLLRTPYIGNNLAILIAETERDHCNKAVEVFGNKQSNAEDQCLQNGFPILPVIVAAIDKLNSHSKDDKQAGNVVVQMMRESGSFDTDLSKWTETTVPQAQIEERWKMLLMAAGSWRTFPVVLTQLLLKTSLPNNDFDVLLRYSDSFVLNTLPTGPESFVHLCKWIIARKALCTSTMAEVVKLLRAVSNDKESILVPIGLVVFLRRIDGMIEGGGEQAEKRSNDFIKIFLDLRFQLLTRRHGFPFLLKVSDDLVKCYCTGTLSAEELKLMVRNFLYVAENGFETAKTLWQVLVTICCSARIVNKAGLWNKYLNILPSFQRRKDGFRLQLAIGGALGVLAEENALSLLDQVLPDLDFLSRQVTFFNRFVHEDVNGHFLLMSSIIQRTAAADKAHLVESLTRINMIISSLPVSAVIPGSVYDTLVVAVAGSVAVGTRKVMLDYHVCRCVAGALCSLSEPMEVLSMYLKVKFLLVRARESSASSNGQLIHGQQMMAPVQVLASDIWMDTFVNGAAILLSTSGSVSQKMSYLSTFHDAVCRDGIREPQELCKVIADCMTPFKQNECDEYRNSLFKCMEEMLHVDNILKVLGRAHTEKVQGQGKLLCFPRALPTPLTCLILEKFPGNVKCKEALKVYRFLALLVDKDYLHALLRVFPAVLKNHTATKDVLDELQILTNILMSAPPAVLPLVTDWLVASYFYNVSGTQRESFVKEIMKVQGISANMHNLLQTSRLFAKGWQKTGDVQEILNKLLEMLRHVNEDFLSRYLPAPIDSVRRVDYLPGREGEIFCEELHWLLLNTDLSPTDVALCIKLTLPSFYRDILSLQGPEYVPEAEGNHEESTLRSPIRVARAFLLTLRCNLSIGKNQERLLEKLLRAVFESGWFPPCCDVLTEDATSGKIVSPGRPRTMRESVTDLLKLITLSKSESELVFWLETPCLLTCGHTMNVVLETCKWRADGQEADDESRMDINCKVGCFLKMMIGMHQRCVGFPIHCLPKLLQLNLNHKLSAKLLDLNLLNEGLALACGSIVSKWQSSEEGLALPEKLISLWKEKTKSCSDLPGEFEIDCVSSIIRCQPVPESAERVVRLFNQLHARRMLGEHHPLHKATCWTKEVSPLKISPEVTAAWLTIFYAANVKWHDVSVIAALTPTAMDLLTPGSTCIKDCLFTSHTVNKILISNQERVNEKELKFALTLARLLNDFLVLAQRLENSGSPNSSAVVAILQDASYKLCKSFMESADHRYSQNGRENREKIPHLAASQGRQSTDDTQLVAHPDSGTDNSAATSASSRYKHPDSRHLAEVPTFMVQGTFSKCLNTGDGATASSVNREFPIAEDPTLKDDVGQWSAQEGKHQSSLRVAMKELHRIRRHYLKKVLVEMYGSNESNPTHPESMLMGRKNSLESVLLLLRRWLATTASKDTKAPVLKGHMDRIFSIIVRGNHLPTVQRSSHSSEAVEVSSSPRLVVAVDANCKEGTETDSDTFLCSEDAITKTERRVSSPGYPPPLAGSTDVVAVVNSQTQTAASTPVPSAVATTVAANYEITTTVSQLQPSGTVGSSSVVDLSAPNNNQAEYSSVPESSTMKRTSPKQAASNFREDEHAQHGDDCVPENSLPQVVQDYVFNLSDNQACIARLQRSGYNQCEASDDDKRPRNLWYDPCIKLSGLVSKQQDVRDLEETGRLRNICNEYLDLLMFAKVESVDINGESLPVRNLFAYELSLKELNQQIAVVRQRLQKLQDFALQDWYQRVSQKEEEFRRSITVLRELSSQETQEESDQQKEARTFSILWENQFFEAIKLCSENIPGCYAPNGFHSHKPIQCALCVDSRIISVFEESGKSRKEVENVEVKLLEAGMFVYDLHSGQLEMATDELWAAFYKFLLEKRLVPKIILSKNSPAFGWARRLVGSEGEEELDAREMKFHETVIPMQESYYDRYPSFGEKNGKDVHTAALTLTAENVKHFVFSDLQLLDPSDTDTKGSVRQLTREVMSDLRDKLLEKFQKADGQLLLGCLGHAVPKVCGQVIRDNLSTREMERNLKLGIDVTKLWKDIKEAHKVEVEWFVETIVNLIIEKRPNQDI